MFVIEMRERSHECIQHNREDRENKRERRDDPKNCAYFRREHHWTS